MNELIQQARELCEKATPGPWYNFGDWMIHTEPDIEHNGIHNEKTIGTVRANNAAFIAASRALVPQLCDALEAAEAENRWIPVSERLPKKPPDYFKDGHWWMVSGEDFIVVDSDGKVYEAHWTYGCSCQNYFWYVNSLTPLTNITHWRPLPEPPKGE